jgi:geranylgeranyl diphosphate synthase type I
MLGIFGDEELSGKSVTSDITEGKKTYLIQQFYEKAGKDQVRAFESVFGNQSATPEEIQTVRHLLVDSGAKAAVEDKINTYAAEAYSELASMELPSAFDAAYTELIKKCIERKK